MMYSYGFKQDRPDEVLTMASVREEPRDKVQPMSVRDDILCALCGELYSDPRLLPCLHSFCRRCLDHTINPRSTSLTCHLCRKEILLKGRGVLDFPPNFIINNMLDVAAVRNSDKRPIVCSSCNEQLPATARCIDCMDFLCYACQSAHERVRLTKEHQILTLEQLKNSEDASRLLHRPIFCKEHPSEKIRYFCRTCEDTICRECTVSQHVTGQHDYATLQKAIDSQKVEMVSLHRAIQQKLPLLSRATLDVDDTARKLDARSDLIRSEIQEKTPRLIRALQERERALVIELDGIVQNKKRVLRKQMEQLDLEYQRISTSAKFTELVLAHGSISEILSIKKQLCENLKELLKLQLHLTLEEDDQVCCDSNIDNVMASIQLYGKISATDVEILRCNVVGDIGTAVKGQISQIILVVKNQYSVERKPPKDAITCELRTPDMGIIIPEVKEKIDGTYCLSYRTYSLGAHQLSIWFLGKHILGSPFTINVVGESSVVINQHPPIRISGFESYQQPASQSAVFVNSFGRRGSDYGQFNGVFGVACDHRQQRVIVTDHNNHRVQVFDESGRFLFVVGERGLGDGQFQSPTGVAVGLNSEIVVCERLKGRIQVFSPDGIFHRRYLLNELKASTLAMDPNGRIIIADYSNCCIYILDPVHERWSKFGCFGHGHGELQYPCYVATNSKGHIFVSDMHSCRIQVFDGEGMHLSSIGRKGEKDGELLRPTGIAVDSRGRLFVADRDNHRIQVFHESGTFLTKFGSKGDLEGELNDPHGLAVLSNGKLAEADFRNNRIQIFSLNS